MTKHLVVAAAGTGGHVMPGIAVAKALQDRGWTVSWIGTERGMEKRLVEQQGIEFEALDFQGLRGKGLKTMLFGGFKLLSSMNRSRKLLKEKKADVLFSTGGYVAVPVALAAGLQSIPYVLMNSDAQPLLSIRMIQGNASGLMCGFDGEAAQKAGDKALVTGNPVRAEIVAIPAPQERYAGRQGPLSLLVFGGSLGAKVLNENVPRALAGIPESQRPTVVHQCGRNAVEEVRLLYESLNVKATVVPFIEDMASAYAACDLVISRAGAISVSELMVAGVPAVLVPLVVKTTSHQKGNAEYVEKAGAGIYLAQSNLRPETLASTLMKLNREQLLAMAQKARALGKPKAADLVADFIEHITG